MIPVKPFLYYLLLLPVLVLSSCKKEADVRVFDKSADSRLSEVLQRYNDVLTAAPYGWKTTIYPASGGYAFYFEFKKDGTVTSFADVLGAATPGTPINSTYRLKALQQPTLIFDTYTYLHVPADPDGQVNGGNNGEGVRSDFEFAIDSVSASRVYLKGTVHGTVARLIPATEAEQKGFYGGEFANSFTRTISYVQANKNLYLDLNKQVPVFLDLNRKIFTMAWVDSRGQIQQKSAPFIFNFTFTGIVLSEPFTYGNLTFRELLWDKDNGRYYVLFNGAKNYLKNSTESLTLIAGATFENIVLPEGSVGNTAGIPGQSDKFIEVYNEIKANLLTDNLNLSDILFVFNNANTAMNLAVFYRKGNETLLAVYRFSMTKGANGQATFSLREAPRDNASLIAGHMSPLLSYLTADTFRFDQQFTGSVGRLGRMNSLTRTNFFFTGAIFSL